MDFAFTFLSLFAWASYLVLPLLLMFLIVIVFLGQIVGWIEKWNRFDSLYWSFVTATTVGYGDIRPVARTSKALSIMIALLGIMFTGIIVSVTLYTASKTLEKHANKTVVQHIKKQFEIETHENN